MDPEEIRYRVLRAIIQVHSQHPNNLVSDTQIMEITGLDRQTVQDEMDLLEAEGYIQAANGGDEHQAWPTPQGRRLFNDLAARRGQPPRARDIQQRILQHLSELEPRAQISEFDLADALHLDRQLVQDNLELLQAERQVKLYRHAGGPVGSRMRVSITPLGRTIAREPDYMPAASSIPTLYDQPGWQVHTVNNIAGNVYAGPAQNRQEPRGLEVADLRFELESYCGIAACLEVRNWTDRAKKVWVFVYPQSEEPLIPLTGNSASLNPTVIDAEDTEEIRVPLRLRRVDPSKHPLIVSVEVRDALGRKTFVPDELIERLNAQIAAQWPYAEPGE